MAASVDEDILMQFAATNGLNLFILFVFCSAKKLKEAAILVLDRNNRHTLYFDFN